MRIATRVRNIRFIGINNQNMLLREERQLRFSILSNEVRFNYTLENKTDSSMTNSQSQILHMLTTTTPVSKNHADLYSTPASEFQWRRVRRFQLIINSAARRNIALLPQYLKISSFLQLQKRISSKRRPFARPLIFSPHINYYRFTFPIFTYCILILWCIN